MTHPLTHDSTAIRQHLLLREKLQNKEARRRAHIEHQMELCFENASCLLQHALSPKPYTPPTKFHLKEESNPDTLRLLMTAWKKEIDSLLEIYKDSPPPILEACTYMHFIFTNGLQKCKGETLSNVYTCCDANNDIHGIMLLRLADIRSGPNLHIDALMTKPSHLPLPCNTAAMRGVGSFLTYWAERIANICHAHTLTLQPLLPTIPFYSHQGFELKYKLFKGASWSTEMFKPITSFPPKMIPPRIERPPITEL